MDEKPQNRFYSFGEFRLDANEQALFHGARRISLTPKAIELLTTLIQRRGETVTKNELMDSLWRDTYVDENNLAVTVMMLRKAFGEAASDKKFIETVPKRGYRFVAPVEVTNADLLIEKQTLTRITIDETRPRLWAGSVTRSVGALAAVLVAAGIVGLIVARSFSTAGRAGTGKAAQSIAVLPMKNLGEAVDDPLSLGLTDALITKLGGIRDLAVRPTSAVMPFAADPQPPNVIGQALKVENVLESSVRHEGDRLRVSVQLIKTSDGSILWSGNFDETHADLFRFEDSIAARVAQELRVTMTSAERAQIVRRGTEDAEAYKLYLRARHAWNKRTPEGMQQSIQLFQEAIDRDPTYALAFAGLADAYVLLSEYNTAPPRESYPKAEAAAQRALEIDTDLAEAHTTLAYALANYDWNFAEAEREYRLAIGLNPNYATAHQWYAEFLSAMSRFDEAKAEIRRAEDLDPLSPIIQSIVGLIAYHSRDFEAAIVQYQKTIESHPTFAIVYAYQSLAYEQKRMYDEAFEAEAKLLTASGMNENQVQSVRDVYRQRGWKGYLQTVLLIMDQEAAKHYVNSFSRAHLYMRLGDREHALEWLERSYDERLRYVIYLNADANADFLIGDPRFQDLLHRIGLKNSPAN